MSARNREPRSSVQYEVVAHRTLGDEVVFASSNEAEAVSFAIEYASRHPIHAIRVNEEYYDPSDQLFKSRRVWFRAPSHQAPAARQRIVTLRR
jgi:hypothetical protein